MNPVLIVEDEKAIADLIEMTLEPFGYVCSKAGSGEEAADLIEKRAFDLILLDVMLPGVDGFALMDYITPTAIEIQPESRTVTRDGAEIRLKPKEYDLLMVLVYNRGIALYRDVLLERVWGLDCDVMPRTLPSRSPR